MDPLATVADITARGVTIDEAEVPLVETYLESASAAVRDAAGTPISRATSTVALPAPAGAWLRLPALPVVDVAAVTADGEEVGGWRLIGHRLHRGAGWGCTPVEVAVTYTHGLAEVPADIVDLVCRIAVQTLIAHRGEADGTGIAAGDIRSERIGDYSVTYGDDGSITELELSERLTERLRGRFGGGAAVVGAR